MLSFVLVQFFHITLLPVCHSSWEPFWLEGKSWLNPLELNPWEEIWGHSFWRWDGWDIHHLFVVRTPIVQHGLLTQKTFSVKLFQEKTWLHFWNDHCKISDYYSFNERIVFSSVSLSMKLVGHLVVETGNIDSPNPTFCLMLRGMNETYFD